MYCNQFGRNQSFSSTLFSSMTPTSEQVKDVFRRLFEEKFKNAELKLITLRYPYYFEEDDNIRVMIVYKILSGDDLDLHEGMHFSLNASDKLSEINEYRIPVMSFVEYEDYMTNTPKELLLL